MKRKFFRPLHLGNFVRIVLLGLIVTLSIGHLGFTTPSPARAAGLNWPVTQMFPSFSSFTALDVMDLSGLPDDQKTLFSTLEGLVNRTQTRIYALDNWGEGKTYWLDKMVATGVTRNNIASPFSLITKYRTELQGIIIYDPGQMDTVNLATTIAGVRGAVVASPALAPTLNAAPYNLPTLVDLRTANGGGAFTSTLQIYQYGKDNYWAQTSHRIFFGLQPGMTDLLRDYVVAVQGMVVWLDPSNASQLALLNSFWDTMPPVSPYVGWWPDEPAGVRAAALKGLPVFAADWLANASVFGGTSRTINVPAIPATPPLQNKIYVQLLMSDGDNVQENQHLSPLKWADANRGKVPLTWTFSPADVDLQPIMLNHFYSIATPNDVIVSGPSGLGYTYPSYWPTGWLTRYARMTNDYLNAAGMRVITLWNNGNMASAAVQSIYTQQMPRLLGMPLQDGALGAQFIWNGTMPTIVHQHGYANNQAEVENAINQVISTWNGTQPTFVSVQGNLNQGVITPSLMYQASQTFSGNTNVVFVRGDHFFQLMRQANGLPVNPASYTYEAEATANTLGGTATRATCATAAGGQIVRNTMSTSSLQFNQINVATAGSYKLTINYFNGDAATLPALMSINGAPATTLNFPSQSIGWCDQGVYSEGMFTTLVNLNAGNNTIKFSSPNTTYSPDYDSISLSTATGQAGYWALNETSGTAAADSSGNGKTGTLNGAPTWTSGKVNGALNFNGTGDFVAVNSGTVKTRDSYSAAAWVQLSNTASGYATAMSQDGATISSFFLQYSAALGNKFAFSILNSDSITAPVSRAISTTSPAAGTWYHVIGVRDAATNQIKLYVNGVLESTQPFSSGWAAAGNTMIGRAKWGGANVDFWPGKLDEVRTFNYALSDSEISTLYNVTTTTIPTNTPAPPTPTIPPAGNNLALNKPATSSGNCATTEGPDKAVNGSVSGGNADKWCGNAATKWMQVDLGANYNINQFIVRHAGAGGEATTMNTSAFTIQLSTDNVNWSTPVTVSGNTANVTTHNITATTGRYVRLNITNAGGDGVARIYEFEVYGSSTTQPTNTPVPPTPTRTNTPNAPTNTPSVPTNTSVAPTATPTRTNTPTPPSGTNLALNKPATSSGNCATNEGPDKAVNGSVSGGNADKWCGNAATKWMQVDLGANYNITQFIVRHAGAGGESTAWNTNAFTIQTSTDNVNWITVVTVSSNTASITTHNITARTGRYARLNITNAGGDGVARIYEFEVYGSPISATNTPTSTGSNPAWAANVSYSVGALVSYAGLNYRCIQAHTSLVGWEPPNAPSLWQLV